MLSSLTMGRVGIRWRRHRLARRSPGRARRRISKRRGRVQLVLHRESVLMIPTLCFSLLSSLRGFGILFDLPLRLHECGRVVPKERRKARVVHGVVPQRITIRNVHGWSWTRRRAERLAGGRPESEGVLARPLTALIRSRVHFTGMRGRGRTHEGRFTRTLLELGQRVPEGPLGWSHRGWRRRSIRGAGRWRVVE